MKSYFLLILSVACLVGSTDVAPRKQYAIEEASMNAYMDIICIQVGPWIRSNGWIPMLLPNIETTYDVQPIWITYSADLWLWDGVLDRFDGVVRQDNAVMYYKDNILKIDVGIAIRNLAYRYDYQTRVLGMGFTNYTGWVEGGTDRFSIRAVFSVNIDNFYISMDTFDVGTVGSIWTKLHGNVLLDWLMNALINTMTWIFRGLLTDYVAVVLRDTIQGVIDGINGATGASPSFNNIGEVQQFIQNFADQGFGLPQMLGLRQH